MTDFYCSTRLHVLFSLTCVRGFDGLVAFDVAGSEVVSGLFVSVSQSSAFCMLPLPGLIHLFTLSPKFKQLHIRKQPS